MFSGKLQSATAGAAAVYIEDVFSTYLYTGTSGSPGVVVNNGIDLAGKGGLVWLKCRSDVASSCLFDTERGANSNLVTDTTAAASSLQMNVFGGAGFTSNGFNLLSGNGTIESSGRTYASWTFRKQPKFFDVVTYTGTGVARTIAHSLGSVPGCIMVKRTDTTANWQVYHRSLANTEYLVLNTNAIAVTSATRWNSMTPTSTVFSIGTDVTVNESGGTYVAYIFAHNAGGFGLIGTDNVISCGSYIGDGNLDGPSITLGYEPQFIIVRPADTENYINWNIGDTMRGLPVIRGFNNAGQYLATNTNSAEETVDRFYPTSKGFKIYDTTAAVNTAGAKYIYIAIRKGPMKVPTDATKVFKPLLRTGTGSDTTITGAGFTPDFLLTKGTAVASRSAQMYDRLRGKLARLQTVTAGNEIFTSTDTVKGFDAMDGVLVGTDADFYGCNASGASFINYFFKRAPGFFDEVCYTGTSASQSIPHNLSIAPELMIIKNRSTTIDWIVGHSYSWNYSNYLNSTAAFSNTGTAYFSPPTSSNILLNGGWTQTNVIDNRYVAYLFATCAGVSKVGSYTGTGAMQTIACGFAAGARFVLIKRTDSDGDWYYWDTTRGIIAGNDPYLLLNTNASQVTDTDYIDPVSTGFQISSTAPAAINASGGSYIFLAIA